MKVKVNEKALRWVMLAIVVACFAWNYAGVFDKKMDMNGDNYVYFQLARSLAQGRGYVTDVGPTPMPHMHFPPGYPTFLALFFRIFPDNVVAMKLINGLLMLVSLLLLFRIIRKTTGPQGHWIALAACLLTASHCELLRWSTIIMSEMLYTALTLGIIALCLDLDLEKVRRRDVKQILMLAGLCLLIAALYFVRTMGVSLVLAVALTFLILGAKAFIRRKKEGRSWVVPLLAAFLVILSFGIAKLSWDHRNQRVAPGHKSEYLNTFSQPVPGEDDSNKLTFFATRVKNNLKAFVPYYIPNALLDPNNAAFKLNFPEEERRWVPGILVLVFMLLGLLSMKGLSLLLILYFLATFGALMLYPAYYADIRYFIPLVPLMLGALVAGVCRAVHFLIGLIFRKRPVYQKPKWLPVVTPALCLLMLALLLPRYYESQKFYRDFAKLSSFGQVPKYQNYQTFLDLSAQCALFPKDWLFVSRKPEIFYVHSRYHHALSMPREGNTPEDVVRFLMENNVDILVLDAVYRTSSTVIIPTMNAYPHLFTVLVKKEDGSGAIVGFLPSMQKR